MRLCLPRGFALPQDPLLFLPRGRAGLCSAPLPRGRRDAVSSLLSLPRPLRRALSPLPSPRRKTTLARRHTSRFRRSKGRAHVAMTIRGGLSKKTSRRPPLSSAEKPPLGYRKRPRPRYPSACRRTSLDGWQGHALCVAGGVVVDGGLRSSQRSSEPPSSMRTLVPASRCAL